MFEMIESLKRNGWDLNFPPMDKYTIFQNHPQSSWQFSPSKINTFHLSTFWYSLKFKYAVEYLLANAPYWWYHQITNVAFFKTTCFWSNPKEMEMRQLITDIHLTTNQKLSALFRILYIILSCVQSNVTNSFVKFHFRYGLL